VILSLWLALHLALGFLVTRALWPLHGRLALRGALSVGMGCGFGSCLYFLGMLAGLPAVAVAAVELVAAVGLLLRPWAGTPSPRRTEAGWTLPSVFALCMLLGVIGVIVLTLAIPHGTWDAWAIWNLRARFLVRAGADWRVAFSPLLAEHHPDYPLLLPAMHAFGWKLSGSESILGPAAVALAFTLSVIGLLWSGLDLLRGRRIAYLGALVLVAAPFFWKHGVAQYADIPLAFFLLGSLVLLALDRQERHPGLAVLAGLCAGFGAWTKNEGIALAALLTVAVVIAQRGSLPGFLLGLLPGALCLAIFKLTLAPPSYLMASVAQPLSARLADLTRYPYLASGLAVELLGFGETPLNPILLLIACFVLLGRDPKRPPLAVAAITLAGGLAAYLGVLLASPLDFQWQISTALPRLLLQLWPSAILLCFLALREPEPPAPEEPKKKKKKR
jgi:hypothetical protein